MTTIILVTIVCGRAALQEARILRHEKKPATMSPDIFVGLTCRSGFYDSFYVMHCITFVHFENAENEENH